MTHSDETNGPADQSLGIPAGSANADGEAAQHWSTFAVGLRSVLAEQWVAIAIFLSVVAGLYAAVVTTPTPAAVVSYVDERGWPVSKEEAEQHFAEKAQRNSQYRRLVSESLHDEDKSGPTHIPTTTSSRLTWRGSEDRDTAFSSGFGSNTNRSFVRGYTTRSGRYVAPHSRSKANGTDRDNWSTRGNRNPVTARAGSKKARR